MKTLTTSSGGVVASAVNALTIDARNDLVYEGIYAGIEELKLTKDDVHKRKCSSSANRSNKRDQEKDPISRGRI